MGKKIFAAMVVAVVAMVAGYNIYQSQRTKDLSDLALDNVEALAEDEGFFDDWWSSKVYDCQIVVVWETRYMQYKDVPRDSGNWEITMGNIDPEDWGYCLIQVEQTDCVSGNSVAHCWDC